MPHRAENLLRAIAASKEAGLERLTYALGIRNVGEVAAAALAIARDDGRLESSAQVVADCCRISTLGMQR